MTKPQFTPGPWTVETVATQIGHAHKIMPVHACLYVDHRDAKEKDMKTHTAHADANLIAAAPELYIACEAAKKFVEEKMDSTPMDSYERKLFWNLTIALAYAQGAR